MSVRLWYRHKKLIISKLRIRIATYHERNTNVTSLCIQHGILFIQNNAIFIWE